MIEIELHNCVSEIRSIEMLKLYLDPKGAWKCDLEAKNVNGETALHVAARNGCDEAVKMLIDYGAKVDARTNNSTTPLHLAVGYAMLSGDNSVVKTLLEYKADSSAKDKNGMTPRNYLPARLQDLELLRLLCQNNGLGQTNISTVQQAPQNFVGQTMKEPPTNDGDGMGGKMDAFQDELSTIVGLRDLKLKLLKWARGILLDEKRRAMRPKLGPRKLPHMVFLGNPGTGKTTVARILGELLKKNGVLSSDKVIEVQRTDLVAEYTGQTGPKTRIKIKEAMGGILFVDEAYRLTPVRSPGHSEDFGVEALEEIMSVLEDGNILVIFAGYTEPMKRVFSTNAGFCRRIAHFFQFDDFTCEELARMAMIKMSKQNNKSRLHGFDLHPTCTSGAILELIQNNTAEKLRSKMNGGLVDHMLNNARENLDSRVNLNSEEDELFTVTLTDLEAGLQMLPQLVNVE